VHEKSEDLVKRLRNRRIAIMQTGGLDDVPLLREAANKIEELSAVVETYKKYDSFLAAHGFFETERK